jgi:hypothetical protein
LEQGVPTLAQALIGRLPIAAWTLVAVAFFALAIVVYFAIRGRARRIDLQKTVQAFRSLDIEAFRNLVDPAEEAFLRDNLEEAFLRDNLPPKKFREIKRQRARAALLYAWEAGRAATALARIGQAARQSTDPQIAASGIQLSENAFRLRLQTIGASLYLLTEILLPDLQTRSIPPLVDQYGRAAETLFRLGRFSSGVRGLVRSKSA